MSLSLLCTSIIITTSFTQISPGYTMKMVICNGSSATLSCGNNFFLDVEEANYGRLDATTCRNEENRSLSSATCRTDESLVVKEMCQNKTSCFLTAANFTSRDDLCPDTNNYLEVNYTCTYLESNSGDHTVTGAGHTMTKVTICEHSPETIRCEGTSVLEIKGANYGRLDRTTCNANGSANVSDTSCRASDSLERVIETCQHLSSCSLTITNSFSRFGDPCVGTDKYLEVNYTCITEVCPSATHYWTEFLDGDNPSGDGDFETFELLSRLRPGKVCENVYNVEAQTLEGVPYQLAGERVVVNNQVGFYCRNQQQEDGNCKDYKARFCCPKEIEETTIRVEYTTTSTSHTNVLSTTAKGETTEPIRTTYSSPITSGSIASDPQSTSDPHTTNTDQTYASSSSDVVNEIQCQPSFKSFQCLKRILPIDIQAFARSHCLQKVRQKLKLRKNLILNLHQKFKAMHKSRIEM